MALSMRATQIRSRVGAASCTDAVDPPVTSILTSWGEASGSIRSAARPRASIGWAGVSGASSWRLPASAAAAVSRSVRTSLIASASPRSLAMTSSIGSPRARRLSRIWVRLTRADSGVRISWLASATKWRCLRSASASGATARRAEYQAMAPSSTTAAMPKTTSHGTTSLTSTTTWSWPWPWSRLMPSAASGRDLALILHSRMAIPPAMTRADVTPTMRPMRRVEDRMLRSSAALGRRVIAGLPAGIRGLARSR